MGKAIRTLFDRVPEDERPQVGEAETSANFGRLEVHPVLEHLNTFSIPPDLTVFGQKPIIDYIDKLLEART